jgi:hypothetical protein
MHTVAFDNKPTSAMQPTVPTTSSTNYCSGSQGQHVGQLVMVLLASRQLLSWTTWGLVVGHTYTNTNTTCPILKTIVSDTI